MEELAAHQREQRAGAVLADVAGVLECLVSGLNGRNLAIAPAERPFTEPTARVSDSLVLLDRFLGCIFRGRPVPLFAPPTAHHADRYSTPFYALHPCQHAINSSAREPTQHLADHSLDDSS